MSWGLWERFGVEQEYMIVRCDTLDVMPKADVILRDVAGLVESEIAHGVVGLSNELVSHVVELKAQEPLTSLAGWSDIIAREITAINATLAGVGARLLPTAVHPWMDPARETVLWPYESHDIYQAYDRIFNCKGHGWANLQSTHLNLSFTGDEEFGRLHAAVRAVLPVIPALSASSPFLDGRFSGYHDARLETYRHNQIKIPIIAGSVIPEQAFSFAEYERVIFNPVREAIKPHDPEGLLSHHFLNSRGAIARFDRGAIEIRIIDLQECPAADLAILQTVVALLKRLCDERWVSMGELQSLDTARLAEIFLSVVKHGEDARIEDAKFLRAFGLSATPISASELWPSLKDDVELGLVPVMEKIIERGSLSSRLLRKLGHEPKPKALHTTFQSLADCLAENRLWDERLS